MLNSREIASGRVELWREHGKLRTSQNRTESVLTSSSDGKLYIDAYGRKRIFHGTLSIRIVKNRLRVINITDQYNYLRGVVAEELGERFSLEALKAQAVCARTWLFVMMSGKRDRDYDVTDISGEFQTFRGTSKSGAKCDEAVKSTEGLVLFNKDGLLRPYYHSTCGGFLEPADKVWNNSISINSEKKRKRDRIGKTDNCSASPYYRWEVKIAKRELYKAVGGDQNLEVKDIEFISDKYGLLRKVILISVSVKSELNGHQFKRKLEKAGISGVRSIRLTVRENGDCYLFSGSGFGHLTGMCQWGAEGLSKNGKTFREILQFYFENAEIKPFN